MRHARWISLSMMLATACSGSGVDGDDGDRSDQGDTTLHYGDREFDIRQFIGIGESTIQFMVDTTNDDLYWIRKGFTQSEIVRLPRSGGKWDESAAETVFEFGQRSLRERKFNPETSSFLLVADENLDETLNVYQFKPADRTLTKLTDRATVDGFTVSPASNHLIYLGRKTKNGGNACAEELDLADPSEVTELFCGTPELQAFIFEAPLVDAADGRIALAMAKDSDNSNLQLVIFRRATGKLDVVSDPSIARSRMKPLAWRGDKLYFITENGGEKESLLVYDDTDRSIHVAFDNQLPGLGGLYQPELDRFVLNPFDAQDHLAIFDPVTEKVVIETATGAIVPFITGGNAPILSDGTFVAKGGKNRGAIVIGLSAEATVAEEMVTELFAPADNDKILPPCKQEIVEYETFDTDEATGKPRKISATLLRPAVEVTAPAAMIYAHGGPSFRYLPDSDSQALCQLGYFVLGPDVRGSTGKGEAFEKLNDKDWGGGDYLDYEHARRFVERELKVDRSRIGLIGHSYGGYMVNWAMTRDDNEFALGISMAGLSNLLTLFGETSVKDNLIGELGDPTTSTEIEKLYIDRSPATFADAVSAPLLLIHGDRDTRTSAEQSRAFHEQLQGLGKDSTFVEVPAAGHFFEFPGAKVKQFQAIFDMLHDLAPVELVAPTSP